MDAPDSWVLDEDVDVTITSVIDEDLYDDHLEILIARVSAPGAYLMRAGTDGRIMINGEYADLGDNFGRYCGIFDSVTETMRPYVGYCLRIAAGE
jgi:hypothetical protein